MIDQKQIRPRPSLESFLNYEPRKLHCYGPELLWLKTARDIIGKMVAALDDCAAWAEGEKNFAYFDEPHSARAARKCLDEIEKIAKGTSDG